MFYSMLFLAYFKIYFCGYYSLLLIVFVEYKSRQCPSIIYLQQNAQRHTSVDCTAFCIVMQHQTSSHSI